MLFNFTKRRKFFSVSENAFFAEQAWAGGRACIFAVNGEDVGAQGSECRERVAGLVHDHICRIEVHFEILSVDVVNERTGLQFLACLQDEFWL